MQLLFRSNMGASDRRQVPDVPGTQQDCKREENLRARPVTGLPRDRSRFHPRVLYSLETLYWARSSSDCDRCSDSPILLHQSVDRRNGCRTRCRSSRAVHLNGQQHPHSRNSSVPGSSLPPPPRSRACRRFRIVQKGRQGLSAHKTREPQSDDED